MNNSLLFSALILSSGIASAATLAGQVGIDFGNASATSTLVTTSGYNAYTAEPGAGASASLSSVTNTLGVNAAGVSFAMQNNTNNSATRAAALNPTVYIVNDQKAPNDVVPTETVTLTFSGLDPALTYDLTGGYQGGTNANFDANWTSGGTTLLADASATGFVTFTDLSPTAGGDLVFTVAGTATGATHITIDHLILTGVPVPEPSSAALLGFGFLAFFGRRKRS